MARKRQRGQRVDGEDPDLEHLGAGSRPAAGGKSSRIGDSDHARSRALRDVVHADEACHFDMSANFFEAFASRRIPRTLVVVDESAGQAPQAAARFDRTTPQQNSAIDLDHHRRRDFGVVPQHEVVVGTGLDFAAFDHSRHKLGAAVDAVVAHPANSRSKAAERV
jgi:hypothetical protein